MFADYTTVKDEPSRPWLKWREIVIERRRPRKMFVQANTVLNGTITTKGFYAVSTPMQGCQIFSWYNIPKREKIYLYGHIIFQMDIKYTKWQ
jgi:hypothetical protein